MTRVESTCAPICSTSSFRPSASRCGPASPRDAARLLVVRPGARRLEDRRRARSAGPARSRRRAGRQRHQGDPGAADGPAHRPRHRAEDRGDADRAARRLALARLRAAGARSSSRATSSASARRARSASSASSTPRWRAKGEGGEVTLSFAFHGPVLDQAIDERGDMPLPPYIASQAQARRRATAPTTRPCSRATKARSRRRPRGCISPTS